MILYVDSVDAVDSEDSVDCVDNVDISYLQARVCAGQQGRAVQ